MSLGTPNAVSYRVLCTQIQEHPFFTRVVFGELDVLAFQEDYPLSVSRFECHYFPILITPLY